jgi:DNA-directed RNA polymerase subunit L
MKVNIIEKKKEVLEIEFDDKTLPNALLAVLMKNKVDAYAYEPHPLMPGYRLHIETEDPVKELKAALKEVETSWNAFAKELKSGLAPAAKRKKK